MKLIDTHAHLFLPEFAHDLPQVITRAKAAGITHICLPNINTATLPDLLGVCRDYPGYCQPMIGLHPTSVNTGYEKELAAMALQLHQTPHPYIAIGEIGIDLYWDKTYLNEQITAFDTQIQWALTYRLPLAIHCREAFEPVYRTLSAYKTHPELKGIFHSFTGTPDEACQIQEFPHFMIGINGVVTFKNATLPQTLQNIPLERIVLETDSPFLAPMPYRGQRNESSNLTPILNRIAAIYHRSPQEIADITTQNALKVLKMK